MKTGFITSIHLREYVELPLHANPKAYRTELIQQLESAIAAYRAGARCQCGTVEANPDAETYGAVGREPTFDSRHCSHSGADEQTQLPMMGVGTIAPRAITGSRWRALFERLRFFPVHFAGVERRYGTVPSVSQITGCR